MPYHDGMFVLFAVFPLRRAARLPIRNLIRSLSANERTWRNAL